MKKRMSVVTTLLMVLISLTTSSCVANGDKKTKLVVLEITAHQNVNLNLTYLQVLASFSDYHSCDLCIDDYEAKLLSKFLLKKGKHRTIAFVTTTEDEYFREEIYSGSVDSQSYGYFKLRLKALNLKNYFNFKNLLSIKHSDRIVHNFVTSGNTSHGLSKELIIYKMPEEDVTIKRKGGDCAETKDYLVCKQKQLPNHIALLNSEEKLVALYLKKNLSKFEKKNKYFPKKLVVAPREATTLNIPEEVLKYAEAGAFKFEYTIHGSTYSIGTTVNEENQWKLLVPPNVKPYEISLKKITDEKLSLFSPELSWNKSAKAFRINIQPPNPYVQITKDGKNILEANLNSLDNETSQYMDQKALTHLSKELKSWLEGKKTTINIQARFARETALTPEIKNGEIVLYLDKMNWYHSHFSLLSPDPVERPMVNPAGWTLRETEKSDAEELANLDAYGKLTTFELHELLEENSDKTFYLHPKAQSDNILLKPVKISIKATELSSGWNYEHPAQQTESLKRTFSPKDFAGFAPIVEIEMKDGRLIELIGETNRYGNKPNQIIDNGKPLSSKEIDIELDRVYAMTPIGLSSFGRTELRADKLDAFLNALEHKSVEQWKKFFRNHKAGLDVYTGDSNATVVIRHLYLQNGESAYEFLPKNTVSNKYHSLSGVIRENVKLWNGQEWKKLMKSVPGHYRFSDKVTEQQTIYILLSAVSLEASNPVSAGENSSKSAIVPLAEDDPLDDNFFSDEDESSENEPVQMSTKESQEPVDNVGRFMALWKQSAVSLAQLLKNKEITTCQVFVVFTDAKKHRFEKLATIALTKHNSNYQTQISDDVSEKFLQYSNHFINSTTLSRRTSTLVRLFAEDLDSGTLLPDSELLFIAPEGKQIKVQKSHIRNSLFRTRYIVGFLKAESKSDIVPVFKEVLK